MADSRCLLNIGLVIEGMHVPLPTRGLAAEHMLRKCPIHRSIQWQCDSPLSPWTGRMLTSATQAHSSCRSQAPLPDPALPTGYPSVRKRMMVAALPLVLSLAMCDLG